MRAPFVAQQIANDRVSDFGQRSEEEIFPVQTELAGPDLGQIGECY